MSSASIDSGISLTSSARSLDEDLFPNFTHVSENVSHSDEWTITKSDIGISDGPPDQEAQERPGKTGSTPTSSLCEDDVEHRDRKLRQRLKTISLWLWKVRVLFYFS